MIVKLLSQALANIPFHQNTPAINRLAAGDLHADEYCVSNNAAIWVPRGTMHSANVLKGSGYFITIKI